MKKINILFLLLSVSLSSFAQVQLVNTGTTANDHTGDPARTAFTKINSSLSWLDGQNLIATAVKTGPYTAVAGDYIPVDASSGSVTITLPTAPVDKTKIGVKMIATSGSNTTTISTGGSDVFNKTGGSTSIALSLLNQGVILQYKSSTGIWYVTGDNLPLSQLDSRYQSTLTNSAGLAAAITDETGSGSAVFSTGPTFTGTVTLPSTTSIGTVSSTEIGYVDNVTSSIQTQINGKQDAFYTIYTKTADYTLTSSDLADINAGKKVLIRMNVASNNTLTFPSDASVNFSVGTTIWVERIGAGTTTNAAGSGASISGSGGGLTDPGISTIYQVVKTASNTWEVQNGSPGTWLSWTPTFSSGFSAIPTGYVSRYKVEGKTCTWKYRAGTAGTSSGAGSAFTMTAPIAAKSGLSVNDRYIIVANNNGTVGVAYGILTVGSNTFTLTTSFAGGTWSAGTKDAEFVISYEID